MISGKKKIHKNQSELACATETVKGSEFPTAIKNVNNMTSPNHKHNATQSGASRRIIRRSVKGEFNGFQNNVP